MKRHLFRILHILMLVITVGCTAVAEKPNEANQAEIYTAVIRQIYTVDDTFGGTLQPSLVYLISQTDDSVGDPSIEQLPAQTLNETLQQDIIAGLADLPAEWIWVNGREAVPIDPNTGQVEENGVIITLGNSHLQNEFNYLAVFMWPIYPLAAKLTS